VSFWESVIELRSEVGNHLPIGNSLIMCDLIFLIALYHCKRQDLSVKQLFAELPHSEMGIRYHLRRLQNRGWVQIVNNPNDRRTKFIVPTEKLIKQAEKLASKVEAAELLSKSF